MEKNAILGVCVCVCVRFCVSFGGSTKIGGKGGVFFQQHLVVVSLYVNCTLGRDVFLFGERFGNEPG